MELKWLLCFTLLVLGLITVQAHMDEEDDHDPDADVIDEDDDLEDGFEETESKTEASTPSPPPKVTYKAPVPTGDVYFVEAFDEGTLEGWIVSKAKKDDTDEEIAKYDGKWEVTEMKDSKLPGDKGLVLTSRAKHHAIAAKLKKPFFFENKPLIVQYEVNFQNGIECGGAYVKLLSKTLEQNLDQFHDKTPYSIMFGPDKCGEDYKLHFIFRHKNPKTGEYEEKHAKRPDADLKTYFSDKKTHLYSLVLNPDNSFEILIDQTVVNSGNMLNDMNPPVNPPQEIEDPNDKKPEDWDERPKIPDPEAVKPEDWDEDAPAKIPDESAVKPEGWLDDEPEYVADPDAEKPEDWDEDMDGEWEAPQIANPKCESAPGCGTWQRPMIDNPGYKGKWKPPMIDNPSYQGIWKPRKIQNPDFFEDLEPFKMTPFNALGLELWSMTSDIFFDNFLICSDRAVANDWASDGWGLKKAADGASEPGLVGQMMAAAEERPWLWVVYILTVALPVFLVILFCCSGKKQPNATDYKKTDAPQPDVKEEEEREEEEREDGGQEEEEEDDDKQAEEKKSDAEEDAGSGSQVEEEDDDAEEEEKNPKEGETSNRSPRNRKLRKD
ncbi:calnexin isoform X1 [Microcaecilia unicolor]|uniref:Calnexin n=1 Tax=Microcaecilia unicolor TaxID=1415580 RepID=A0A6P7YI53_9AMPH|nr:calnexin isoform X1 [Microcaecilia unicolor]XP_030067126.1 calnexin isoform X1 [Microcaecilia unicolor]XP_030067127.1 calnexin isoform X1 [Microcaecilia unicolor]